MTKTYFYNAKIYVEKGNFAEALYQEDGIIKAVGTAAEVEALVPADAERIDCEGRTVIPGFNDSHQHVLFLGQTLLNPDLSQIKNVKEMVQLLKDYLVKYPKAKQIFSQSWNQDFWDDKTLPTKYDLDQVSTEIPIVMHRVCGHSTAVNSKVLELMGIDKDHTEFEGGVIEVDENGEPTGYMTEMAALAARQVFEDPGLEAHKDALVLGMEYMVSQGVTTAQSNDIGNIMHDVDYSYNIVNGVFEEGRALLRYTSQNMFHDADELRKYIASGRFAENKYNDWFRQTHVKILKDGSLGACTGMMRFEYLNMPGSGNRGNENVPEDVCQELCDVATENGLSMITHVIGDDAVEKMAKAYINSNKKYGKEGDESRHVLLHCQITDKPLLQYIADNKLSISYQPVFLASDMHGVEERCGKELSSTSYAHKTAVDLGIHVSYGTDCPIDTGSPFFNLYSAVTRKDRNYWPEGGWNPQECVDVETALDCYTVGSAYQEFREDVKGRLKPGFYADLAILDQDIFTCNPDKIRDTKVLLTMVGGKTVYKAE